MSRTKLIMFFAVVLALGAGAVLGVLASKPPAPPAERSWLADELQLNPGQREQMRKIWSEVVQSAGQDHAERRATLDKDRDDAIRNLMSEEQRARYDKILQDYADRLSEFRKERDKAFQTAVDRTKQILTESQRQKYEELLKRDRDRGHRGFRGPGGPPPGGPPHGPPFHGGPPPGEPRPTTRFGA